MPQTAILNLKINADGSDLDLQIRNLKQLKEAIKTVNEVKLSLDPRSEGFKEVNRQLEILQGLQRGIGKDANNAAKQIDEANRLIIGGTSGAVGHYRQLQAELVRLKNAYKDLSKSDLNGSIGANLKKQVFDISSQLKTLDAGLGDHQRNVGNYGAAFGALGKIFGGTGASIAAVAGPVAAAVAAISAVAGPIIDITAKFEGLQTVLTQNFGGDRIAALETFNKIREFAAKTPFQVDELTQGFIRFQSVGISPTTELLRKVGDFASSQGKSIGQVIEAVVDVGVGQTRRLEELGVKSERVGDNIRSSFKNIQVEVPQTNEGIEKLIDSLSKATGVAGSMEAQSKTIAGSLSNMSDSFDRLGFAIGDHFNEPIASAVSYFSSLVNSTAEFLETPLSEKIQEESDNFNALSSAIFSAGENTDLRTSLIRQMQIEYPKLLENIDAETVSNNKLSEAIALGNLQFQKRIVLAQNSEIISKKTEKVADLERERNTAAINREKLNLEKEKVLNKIIDTGGDGNDLASTIVKRVSDFADKGFEGQLKDAEKFSEKARKDKEDTQKILDQAFFNLFGQTQAEAQKEIDALFKIKNAVSGNDGSGKGGKDKPKAVDGSVDALKEKVRALNDEIDATPVTNETKIKKLTSDLIVAEKELERATVLLEKLKLGIEPTDVIDSLPVIPPQEIPFVARLVDSSVVKLESDITKFINKSRAELNKYEREKKDAEEKEAKEKEELEKKKKTDLKNAAIDASGDIGKAALTIEKANTEKTLKIKEQAIEQEYQKKIAAANGNAQIEAKLREELELKKEKLNVEAAKKRKAIAYKEAIIEAALSAIKAAFSPLQLGIVAVTTAINLALIAATEYATGGFVGNNIKKSKTGWITDSPNTITSPSGDNILIKAKRGELILNESQQRELVRISGSGIYRAIGVPGASMGNLNTSVSVSNTLDLSDRQIRSFAYVVANQTANAVGSSFVKGQNEIKRDIRRERFFQRKSR